MNKPSRRPSLTPSRARDCTPSRTRTRTQTAQADRRRGLAVGVLAAAAIGLAGCGAMQAQNPAGALKPVNATVVEDGTPLMLKGHDVVAYFTEQRHRLGLAQHQSVYEGVTFRFASAQHKALFDANPSRYLPQYGGYCANGIVYGIPWGGDADTWLLRDGKLYIFGGQGSKDAYLLDVPGNQALADRYWTSEVSGSNSFIQRSKRLVLRVPHYKNGEELARLVAASKAGAGSGAASGAAAPAKP